MIIQARQNLLEDKIAGNNIMVTFLNFFLQLCQCTSNFWHIMPRKLVRIWRICVWTSQVLSWSGQHFYQPYYLDPFARHQQKQPTIHMQPCLDYSFTLWEMRGKGNFSIFLNSTRTKVNFVPRSREIE